MSSLLHDCISKQRHPPGMAMEHRSWVLRPLLSDVCFLTPTTEESSSEILVLLRLFFVQSAFVGNFICERYHTLGIGI